MFSEYLDVRIAVLVISVATGVAIMVFFNGDKAKMADYYTVWLVAIVVVLFFMGLIIASGGWVGESGS